MTTIVKRFVSAFSISILERKFAPKSCVKNVVNLDQNV